MTARAFRTLAERCRELQRIAVRDDIREQLRHWAIDFDARLKLLRRSRLQGEAPSQLEYPLRLKAES